MPGQTARRVPSATCDAHPKAERRADALLSQQHFSRVCPVLRDLTTRSHLSTGLTIPTMSLADATEARKARLLALRKRKAGEEVEGAR